MCRREVGRPPCRLANGVETQTWTALEGEGLKLAKLRTATLSIEDSTALFGSRYVDERTDPAANEAVTLQYARRSTAACSSVQVPQRPLTSHVYAWQQAAGGGLRS